MSEPEAHATPAGQPKPWYKRKKIVIPLGVILFFGVISNSDAEDQESKSAPPAVTESAAPEVTQPPQPVAVEETQSDDTYGTYPAAQKKFIKIIEDGRNNIDAAENDLQESVALHNRDDALCKVLTNKAATNWVGVITDIGANGEGKAYVEIELADNVRIKTWNNALSDIGDNTLIPTGASFFDDLVAISEDSKVIWSAKFLSGNNFCLKKANFTETFYGIDPQFIVRFTNIKVG